MSDPNETLPENYAAQAMKQGLYAVLLAVLVYGSILMVMYGCIRLLEGSV